MNKQSFLELREFVESNLTEIDPLTLVLLGAGGLTALGAGGATASYKTGKYFGRKAGKQEIAAKDTKPHNSLMSKLARGASVAYLPFGSSGYNRGKLQAYQDKISGSKGK